MTALLLLRSLLILKFLFFRTLVIIGIMKIKDFLPQNNTLKPAEYSLSDIWAGLFRHSQARKSLQIKHEVD